MEHKKPYPNLIQSLGLVGMVVLGMLIAGMLLSMLGIPENSVFNLLLSNLAGILIAYFPIKLALNKRGTTLGHIIGSLQSNKRYLPPVLVFMIGAALLMICLYYLLIHAFYSVGKISDPDNSLLMLIAAPFDIIFVPIVEEILFRGIILDGFLNNYGKVTSIILSSVLFGVMHINPHLIIMAVIWGIMFSYIYIKTKALWLCIWAHSIANAMVFNNYLNYFLRNALGFNNIVFIITGIVLAGTGLYMLNKTVGKNNSLSVGA